MKTKYDIFISYRRAGGFESANLIAEKLRGMGYSVFFDVESLRSGKFNEQLYLVIEQCKDFVVVLPENALDRCSNEDGTPNEEDWIRKEVLYAMRHQKNIVPVMLSGFEWPEKMSAGLESLKDYQAITASSHETFDLAMLRLSGYLNSKPHKFKLLKTIACVVAILVALTAVAYFSLLQVARPVCTSVANEFTISMGLVHELRCYEDKIKTEWEGFRNSYNTAITQSRKADLETDMLNLLDHKESAGEVIRGQIRPAINLSGWQTVLLGLYGSQKEDIEVLPMFVESYVDEFDTLVNIARRVVTKHAYSPYNMQNVNQNFQFYEHSVNMLFYTYLQEITKFPEGCRKSHDKLINSWNLLPTVSMTLQQEEYERLSQVELSKMEELLNKMESLNTIRENETYDMAKRLDTIEAMADALGLICELQDADLERQNITENQLAKKREIADQKKAEVAEETRKLQQVYEELKSMCQLSSSDTEGYQWKKIICMANTLSQSVETQKMAQQQGVGIGAVIRPLAVCADLCAILDDYVSLHPNSESYITPLRLYYKMVAEGKRTLGGQLIFAFKDDAEHPLYKVGDIVVKRNDVTITDYESLSSAVTNDKKGTVEFLRMEDSKLVLHKENVPESSVLVGYLEVGEY
ncbi:MAG: TIR domain-containing protein [Bacteroidales bacterium]|nr:TIR domain-containing protein [Bacteroidales bacterium]